MSCFHSFFLLPLYSPPSFLCDPLFSSGRRVGPVQNAVPSRKSILVLLSFPSFFLSDPVPLVLLSFFSFLPPSFLDPNISERRNSRSCVGEARFLLLYSVTFPILHFLPSFLFLLFLISLIFSRLFPYASGSLPLDRSLLIFPLPLFTPLALSSCNSLEMGVLVVSFVFLFLFFIVIPVRSSPLFFLGYRVLHMINRYDFSYYAPSYPFPFVSPLHRAPFLLSLSPLFFISFSSFSTREGRLLLETS